MHRFIITVLAIAVLVGGWFGWSAWRTPATTGPAPTFVTVERTALTRSVAATGRVVSNLDVDIKCKASGVVVKLPVDISDTVKQGDLIIQLDPIDEQRNVGQATARLDSTQARLVQAERNLAIAQANLVTATNRNRAALASADSRARDASTKAERMAELLKSKLASQEEADTAATTAQQADADRINATVAMDELKAQELALEVKQQDIVLAKSDVTSDRIALDNAKQRLKDTTVLAPIDGVVATRTVQIGTIISSGITNVGGGTAALTISDLSHLFVLAAVDESDIGQVRLGQDVNITADAFAGRKFHGIIVRIATRGVNLSNVVTFEVKIEIDGEGRTTLRPEMTTNVAVVVEHKNDALGLPNEGLQRRRKSDSKGDKSAASDKSTIAGNNPDQNETSGEMRKEHNGGWFVQVVTAAGVTEERSVHVGINDGTRSEIIDGLAEGEQVQVRKNDLSNQWRGPTPSSPLMPMGGGRMR